MSLLRDQECFMLLMGELKNVGLSVRLQCVSHVSGNACGGRASGACLSIYVFVYCVFQLVLLHTCSSAR